MERGPTNALTTADWTGGPTAELADQFAAVMSYSVTEGADAMRTMRWILVVGLLAVATPISAEQARDPGLESGFNAADQQYRQQRQFEHERRMLRE